MSIKEIVSKALKFITETRFGILSGIVVGVAVAPIIIQAVTMEKKMDFEIELSEYKLLYISGKSNSVDPRLHILYDGEIYYSFFDKDLGRSWCCLTNTEKPILHADNINFDDPPRVQEIKYKRTKIKSEKPKPITKLTETINNYEIITNHTNYPVIGKTQVCITDIYKHIDDIFINIKNIGLDIYQSHKNACEIAKNLNSNLKKE